MPSSSNTKRSQPVAAGQRRGGAKASNKTPRGSPGSPTSTSITPPVTTASHASKRVAKAVRSGKTNKSKTKKVGDGPEAELSDDEDDVETPVEDDTTPEPEERAAGERVVEGISGKSVPKNEISMGTLIAGAKPRPESHNITRGYEFVPSPASRLIIPADKVRAHRLARHDSIASSTGFTDDSDWEKVHFEMDGVDAFSDCESLSLSQRDIGRKKAYADVVKRTYTMQIATASA